MSERKRNRRSWTAQEKLRIVLAGLDPGIEISELCRREGVSPTQYYAWKKSLTSSASRVFNARQEKPSRKEERREAEVARLKDVIAEITAENLELKKRSWTSGSRPASSGITATSPGVSKADEGS